jgi:hypothetical protein
VPVTAMHQRAFAEHGVLVTRSLPATLLVGSLEPGGRELRREQIMRAERDEPVRLDPAAALQHLLHHRLQVVKANHLDVSG